MYQTRFIWAAALFLSGCMPLNVYYNQGVSIQTAKDTETSCKVAAARDVPVRNVTRVIPGRQLLPRLLCDSNNVCTRHPGLFLPPEYITEDANITLRTEAVDLCMRQKGYEFIRLPACKDPLKAATPPAATTHFPKLSSESCVIRNQGGTWQIVSP